MSNSISAILANKPSSVETDILERLIVLDIEVSKSEMFAFASEPRGAFSKPPLKSTIEELLLIAGSLKPKPLLTTNISVIPPFVVSPTYATAPIGLFAVGFKPPTILTGSPS